MGACTMCIAHAQKCPVYFQKLLSSNCFTCQAKVSSSENIVLLVEWPVYVCSPFSPQSQYRAAPTSGKPRRANRGDL